VRIGWSDRETFQAINVTGTRNVAAACRQEGVRLVHVSSTDVFGGCSLTNPTDEETPYGSGPRVPYVESKREAEAVITEERDRGLQVVTVNPAFMLGPWDWKPSSGKLLLAAARGNIVLTPLGCVSLCDVRDVAAGIITARDRGDSGRRYILAGRTMEWFQLLTLMADICNVRRPLMRARPMMLKIGGWGGDWWGKLTGTEPDVNSGAIAMAWLPKNYSSARAADELGYHIRPAEETIRDSWDWFRTHGYC
jgi:dihydroflavonol-4-reductase